MHNRWNPELNTALIPGSERVSASRVERPAEGSLWVKRTELLDTWEYVTLLCVPILDGSGTARGFCGMEISDLYFSLSHDTVSSAYGNMLTLLAPIDGDKLDLSGAMLGATNGTRLTAEVRCISSRGNTIPSTPMARSPIWGGTGCWTPSPRTAFRLLW